MGEWHEQSRVSFRDRLTARTPRSERGGRGSNPCPGAPHGRVAQFAESACLTSKRLLVRVQPRPLLCGRSSAAVERSPETRRGAGSSPAGHTQRLRSSTRQSCRLLIGGLQVRGLPGPLWKDCHRRGIPSRKRVRLRPLGVRLPLLPLGVEQCSDPARSNGYDARLLIAKSRFEPCRRSSFHFRRSVSVAARLADTEQGLVRFQGLRSVSRPRGRAAVTPGSQPGSAGSSPAGGTRLAVGERPPRRFREPETAGSTPAGRTRRTSPWCNRQHGELQPRRSGFESWRVCSSTRDNGRRNA